MFIHIIEYVLNIFVWIIEKQIYRYKDFFGYLLVKYKH